MSSEFVILISIVLTLSYLASALGSEINYKEFIYNVDMLKFVKGLKKEDLKWVLEEFYGELPSNVTNASLKELILSSKEY